MIDRKLLQLIESQYKSLEIPDYTFVRKAIATDPYSGLVERFKTLFEVEEITDSNDDVSFRYLLSQSGSQWVVELSMIGLYATILRIPELGLCEVVTLENAVSQEKEIYSLVTNWKFKVLSKLELEKPITLKLFNTEPGRVCFYNALFSDTDILPWVGQ